MRTAQLTTALCFLLSPLLVAQQDCPAEVSDDGMTSAETVFAYRSSMNREDPSLQNGLSMVPFDLAVELNPVDPEALANATIGSTLTFRVVRDVIRRGGPFNKSFYADAYGGTLIEGKVIRIREGKLRTRYGRPEPRVKEVLVGKSTKLELESSPGGRARFNGIAKNVVVWPVRAVCTVGEYTLLLILLPIFCHSGCDL